jgi:NAD(P)-dependent dehydrogenase (short-subunit alcohol dehydrogenase family)
MPKCWITGAERSLGKVILDELSSTFECTSLSRPEWDLSMEPAELKLRIVDKLNQEGLPSVFIHNAGVMHMDWIEEHPIEMYEYVMRVNATSRFVINQALIQKARIVKSHERTADDSANLNIPSVRIIHIVSISHRMALRQSPAYCASKAADGMLVKQMAKETASRTPNVLIFGVSPGGIQRTVMIEKSIEHLQKTRHMTAEEAKKYNVQSPLQRNADPKEVASVVKYLATEAPIYMHGTNVEISGCL